jgi:tripartite-type tricarboxylate transporter receptor subunit TctC
MLILRFVVWIFLLAMIVLGAGVVSGQDYPNKPVRIVVGGVGGNADFHARRLIAPGLTSALGQPVVVQNRGGTDASAETVANAAPDGYTLLVSGSSFWVAPLLRQTPYDVVKNFLPITMTTQAPQVLVVHPSVPVNSVRDLIDLAKSRPGMLNYAGGSTGGAQHIAGELFKSMAGVDIVAIRYKSEGPGLTGLIGGEVQMMFPSAVAAAPHIKSGKLKALAVTSAQPSALFPGLPTVAASGVPSYESASQQGIWAPAKTPEAIIKRLNQEIVRILSRADIKEQILSIGLEAAPSSPEQFARIIESDMIRMRKLIKGLDIKAE